MWSAEILNSIAAAQTTADVLREVRAAAKEYGLLRGGYHFTAPFSSQIGANTYIVQFGYPEEWQKLYAKAEFRKNDPFPDFVMRHGMPITWKEAGNLLSLSPEQQAFLDTAREFGLLGPDIDGISMPLYGPNGRDAYTTYSFGRNFEPEDEATIFNLLAVSQFSHNRIVQLLSEQFALKTPLSEQEYAVLQWLARQKSLSEIATITSLSRATVDTYVRRIYRKLGVHDRVAAIVAAVRHGLIKL
jgi:DNA-binding CsgD family transcriptional regulator